MEKGNGCWLITHASMPTNLRDLILKVSQFCDDTTILCLDASDVARSQVLLELYRRASNQKLNFSKTTLLPINNPTYAPNSTHVNKLTCPYTVLKPGEAQRLLGVNVGIGYDAAQDLRDASDKIFSQLKKYSNFYFSLQGRVNLART